MAQVLIDRSANVNKIDNEEKSVLMASLMEVISYYNIYKLFCSLPH